MFKIDCSISLFVTRWFEEETERIWNRLSKGGSAMMPLDKYQRSKKYGWMAKRQIWHILVSDSS